MKRPSRQHAFLPTVSMTSANFLVVEEQVDELGDLEIVDGDRGLAKGVMTKSCCFVPSLSFTSHADMP